MPSIDTLVIGAGPAGLAVSSCLTDAAVDHVVLERGRVADRWRTERWDSLQLLSPNWASRLPGWSYDGDDPNGYMTAAEVVTYFERYAESFDAPVREEVTVERLRRGEAGFLVRTSDGTWSARNVVMATGWCDRPFIPPAARELTPAITQVTPTTYRNPEQLPAGGVLVVGASASGVQIADELRRAGRVVTIAAGEHVRLPRGYRGCDVYWWLDRIGQLDERWDEVDNLQRARRHASVQLVGDDEHRDLDLHTLAAGGVQVVGRLAALRDTTVLCSGGLGALVANADLKQARMLRRIDEFAADHALDVGPATAPEPVPLPDAPTELDLREFSTVIWATGYRPTWPWLTRVAFDRRGRIAHDGGVAALPGLYLLGLPFLRRRRSNLISGLGADAVDLAGDLRRHLDDRAAARVSVAVS